MNKWSWLAVVAALGMLLVLTSLVATGEANAAGTTETGTFYVIYGDGPPGSGVMEARYTLSNATGSWNLDISPSALDAGGGDFALNGKTVTVTGDEVSPGNIVVQSISPAGGAGAFPGPALALSGGQEWLTLLCKFADVSAEGENLAFFDDIMSNTKPGADDYWRELSYGNITLVGSSQHDWLDLPSNRNTYFVDDDVTKDIQLSELATDCATVHDDNGVDFSTAEGINFILNAGIGCCAWGGGYGGTHDGNTDFRSTWMPPWAWGTTSHGVLGQEMGHGFGLPHEGCLGTASPYDSQWDVQSAARQVHTNADYKDLLGWIQPSEKYTDNGSANQIIEITRLALPGFNQNISGYLMATIPVDADTYYTVESRKFAGYDESPQSPPGEAVVIHIVELTPADRPEGSKRAQVVFENGPCNGSGGMWLPGELFEDSTNGVSIAIISETDTGFIIAINPDADVAISKTATPDPALAGDLITYDITVVNFGPGPATNVVVTDTLPAGLTYVADTDTCAEAPVGTLTCTAPSTIVPFSTWTFGILAEIDSAIGNGLPTTITNLASVVADQDSGGTNNEVSLTTFVLAEADLLLTKECKPDSPLLTGELGTCTILVDNLGPSMANDVVVTDTHLSEGSFSIGAINTDTGTCGAPAGGVVTCDLGNMDAGARATITVVVSSSEPVDINDCASVTSATPDPITANNQACDGVAVVLPEADLRVTKDCKPDEPLLAGALGLCTILVDNLGPQTAASVVVTDTHLSEGSFNFGAISTDTGVCGGPAGGVVTCNLGNMAPGARATITVQVWANEPVDINDCASVVSDTLDPDNDNNQACDGVTVISLADLAITKVDIPDPVIAGTNLQYDIEVTNNGPSTAVNVVVEDVLPAGVSFVSVSSTGGGACNAGVPGNAALPTTCTFASILSGATETMTIVVTVDPGFVGQLENDVTVSSDSQDNSNANNLATTTTLVDAEADLSVAKTDSPDPVNAGETVKYEVVITNNGPSVSQSVSLADVLPSDVAFVSATITLGSGTCVYNPLPNTVTCNFTGGLNPGESLKVVIEGVVDSSVPDATVIYNTATASAATTDPALLNNSATVDTTVNAVADLVIEKDSTFEAGNPSGNVIYIVTVTNNGPSDALNVVVMDVFPSTAKKFQYVFDTSNGDCAYDETTHELTCDVGTLAPGESWTVEIHMNAKGNLGTITNTATVSSDTTDPNPSNNVVTKDVIVGGGTGGRGGPPPGRGKP